MITIEIDCTPPWSTSQLTYTLNQLISKTTINNDNEYIVCYDFSNTDNFEFNKDFLVHIVNLTEKMPQVKGINFKVASLKYKSKIDTFIKLKKQNIIINTVLV